MKFKYLFPAIFALMMTSCSQIVDNVIDQKVKDSYVSQYKGDYVGTYSGDDSGALLVTISDKDYVTIRKTSNKFGKTETFYGGMIGASFQVNSGINFNGNLISKTPEYVGTWSQNGLSGTWVLKKQ